MDVSRETSIFFIYPNVSRETLRINKGNNDELIVEQII